MPIVHLTDITIRGLVPSERHVTYYDHSLPTFGVRVGKKSKTFVVMLGKERKRVSLGKYPATSLKDARKKAGALIFGTEPLPIKAPLKAAEAVERFLQTRTIKERTADEYHRLFDKHFLASHASRPLSEISTADILKITDRLLGTPAEAIHAHAALKTLFNWALERRLIERSPLAGLRMPAKPTRRERVLSDDEFKAVYRAAMKMRHPFGSIIRICIHTGMRRSEVGALKWSYFTPELVTLPQEVTKNGVQHTLPNLIAGILAAIPQSNEFLFPSAAGTPFSAWSKNKTALDQLSGVTDWVIHDLRRTFATKMAEWQITEPHVVERILNHISGTSLSPLAKIYNRHSYLPQMRVAMERYEHKLRELLGTD